MRFALNMAWVTLLAAAVTTMAAPAPETLVEKLPNVRMLATGDINGDGSRDLAVATFSPASDPKAGYVGDVRLFFRKADGFPAADKTITIPVIPSGLIVGDFDGDGKCDVAVGLRVKRSISLYLACEDFGIAHTDANNNDSAGSGLSYGKVNGKGKADFISGAVWRQWKGGDDFLTAYFSGPTANDNAVSRFADLNGDGLDDIVFITGSAQLRLQYGPFMLDRSRMIRATEAQEIVNLKTPFEAPYAGIEVAVGDLNGDGQADIVAAVSGGERAKRAAQTLVYFQNSPAGFTEGASASLTAVGLTGPLAVADLNGDGLSDLIVCTADVNSVCVFLQKKGVPMALSPDKADVVMPTAVRAGVVSDLMACDVDGDGAMDIVAGVNGGRTGRVLVFKGVAKDQPKAQ